VEIYIIGTVLYIKMGVIESRDYVSYKGNVGSNVFIVFG
jgi:hypothetical protein